MHTTYSVYFVLVTFVYKHLFNFAVQSETIVIHLFTWLSHVLNLAMPIQDVPIQKHFDRTNLQSSLSWINCLNLSQFNSMLINEIQLLYHVPSVCVSKIYIFLEEVVLRWWSWCDERITACSFAMVMASHSKCWGDILSFQQSFQQSLQNNWKNWHFG